MESNNVSQRMFVYLLINIMSNSQLFYLVKSTTNYVTAYRELRKERLVAADDVEFIAMLEGVLDEAQTAKVEAMKNLGDLDEQIVDVESEIVLVEVNLRALKSKKEVIMVVEDSDNDEPASKKPRSAIRVGKVKSWRSNDEMDAVITDVFQDMNTSQQANVGDINSVVDEQAQLE